MDFQPSLPSSPAKFLGKLRVRLTPRVLWAGGIVLCLALGLWTQNFTQGKSLRQGEALTEQIAGLLDSAHEAGARNEFAQAEVDLEKALRLLQSNETTQAQPAYLAVLVDLSSVRLGNANPTPETLTEVRKMLSEAWTLAGKAEPELRARIARERGLTELLDGKPAESRQWYQTAADILPEDEAARARLKLIGRIAH